MENNNIEFNENTGNNEFALEKKDNSCVKSSCPTY